MPDTPLPVGDGITDDTEAIRAHGIPRRPGTYIVSGPVTVPGFLDATPDLARRVELSERVLAKIRQHEGDPCPICRRMSVDLEAHYDEKHGGEA